jgi:hypothetical protein
MKYARELLALTVAGIADTPPPPHEIAAALVALALPATFPSDPTRLTVYVAAVTGVTSTP